MELNNDELIEKGYEESKESFAKSLFYIQLISLILAILSFFFVN
jgi:hypothetical protein